MSATAVPSPPPHVKHHGGHPSSESQVWEDFGDDVFALLDIVGSDLRKLRCRDVATTLNESAPNVMREGLRRAVEAWLTS